MPHQPLHQPKKADLSESPEKPFGDVFRHLSDTRHLVWACVVPDIPAFCRELVADIAGE